LTEAGLGGRQMITADGRGKVVMRRPAAGEEPAFFSVQITEARRFYLHPAGTARGRLAVVCGGGEHCAGDYHICREDFPHLAVEFVAGGEGLLRMNGKSHRLVPGAVFAYGPGVAHDIQVAGGRPLVKYFVGFVGAETRRLMKSPGAEPGQVVQTSAPEELLHLFEDLISAGLRETPYRARICAVLGEHLLLRIAESAVPLGAIGTESFGTYQRCRHYIETHYRHLRGLEELGTRCGLDPAYICRLFGRYDHQSPWQYVLRLKMREALERLQAPGALVRTVASDLGFGDPFQFSRTFRRVFGVSPREFVRRQRLTGGTP
jgi:AraC-like DNA-binding protein